jgi:hypothetical protein
MSTTFADQLSEMLNGALANTGFASGLPEGFRAQIDQATTSRMRP